MLYLLTCDSSEQEIVQYIKSFYTVHHNVYSFELRQQHISLDDT